MQGFVGTCSRIFEAIAFQKRNRGVGSSFLPDLPLGSLPGNYLRVALKIGQKHAASTLNVFREHHELTNRSDSYYAKFSVVSAHPIASVWSTGRGPSKGGYTIARCLQSFSSTLLKDSPGIALRSFFSGFPTGLSNESSLAGLSLGFSPMLFSGSTAWCSNPMATN